MSNITTNWTTSNDNLTVISTISFIPVYCSDIRRKTIQYAICILCLTWIYRSTILAVYGTYSCSLDLQSTQLLSLLSLSNQFPWVRSGPVSESTELSAYILGDYIITQKLSAIINPNKDIDTQQSRSLISKSTNRFIIDRQHYLTVLLGSGVNDLGSLPDSFYTNSRFLLSVSATIGLCDLLLSFQTSGYQFFR